MPSVRHNPDQIRELRMFVEEITRHVVGCPSAHVQRTSWRVHFRMRSAKRVGPGGSLRHALEHFVLGLGKLIDVVDEIYEQELFRQ